MQYADPSGNFPVETVLDVVSMGASAKDFLSNPSLQNLAFLAMDVSAVFLPYVPGSYAAKGIRALGKADDLRDIARAASKVEGLDSAASFFKANSKNIVGSYSDIKKTVKAFNIKGIEVHHLIEKRFSEALGLGQNIPSVTNKFPSVALSKADHQEITKAFRNIIGLWHAI